MNLLDFLPVHPLKLNHIDFRIYDDEMNQIGPAGRVYVSSYDQTVCMKININHPEKWTLHIVEEETE